MYERNCLLSTQGGVAKLRGKKVQMGRGKWASFAGGNKLRRGRVYIRGSRKGRKGAPKTT